MSELLTITNALLEYVIGITVMAWEPDQKFTILPPNIPNCKRLVWVRLAEGFTYNFSNQTPINDEVTIPFSITLLARKEIGQSSDDAIKSFCALFYDKFYYSLHPGSVGYQPQVESITGNDIEEKDDFVEIHASVTIKTYLTRNVVSRDDTVVVSSKGTLGSIGGAS